MPKLAPKTQHARREHILDAAERCFIGKGFHHATMDDICREAQVSSGALYTYFVSKEALIIGLCEREKDRFGKELAKITEATDFLAGLHCMAEQYCCNEPIEKVRLHVEIGAEAGRNALIGNTVRSIDKAVSESLDRASREGKRSGPDQAKGADRDHRAGHVRAWRRTFPSPQSRSALRSKVHYSRDDDHDRGASCACASRESG